MISASLKSHSNFVATSVLSHHLGSSNSSHIPAQVEGANSKSEHYPSVILSAMAYHCWQHWYQFQCTLIIDNCADPMQLQSVLSVHTYASVFVSLAVRLIMDVFMLHRPSTAHHHTSNYHSSLRMRTPSLSPST